MSGTPAYIQPVGVNRLQIAGATALLCDTHERILFNCGESIQRLATEWRLKASKVTEVVMMQLNPAHIGGLVGLLLTLESIEAATFDQSSKRSLSKVEAVLKAKLGKDAKISAYHDSQMRFGHTWIDARWRAYRTKTTSINPCVPSEDASDVTIWWRSICPKKSSQPPKQSFEEYIKLRHTARSIRVWGPPGLADIIKCHVDLTARLRKLILEIVEVRPSARGCRFTRDLFSSLEVNMTLYPIEVRIHAGGKHEGGKHEGAAISDSEKKRRKIDNEDSGTSTTHPWSIPIISGVGKKQLGKLLVEKCKEFNVPSGPMYAKLKSGEDVTLADGTVVKSQDVCEESFDGVLYLITHCVDSKQVMLAQRELIENKVLSSHFARMKESGGLIFNLGLDIFKDDADVLSSNEVTAECSTKIQQITMTEEIGEFGLPFVAQNALNLTLKSLLPALHPVKKINTPWPKIFLKRFPLVPHCKLARFPTSSVDVNQLIKAESQELENRIDAGLREKAQNLSLNDIAHTEAHTCGRPFKANDTRVTLLGTGAAMPSKFRNVSSTIIVAEEGCNILLDCGEGTLSQLFQLYGDNAKTMIANIQFLFVSHKHGDHINGLPGLLEYRAGLEGCPKLHVVAPSEMASWFEETCGCQYELHECEDFVSGVWTPLLDTGSISVTIQTAYVDHINCGYDQSSCFACRIRLSLGKRKRLNVNPLASVEEETEAVKCESCENEMDIAFTGDMAPCKGFTDLITRDSKKLDVLIHEATFEDELAHEAVARKHSTISNCYEAARRSNVGLLILTHFSQRYPSVSPTSSGELKVAYGLDFLTIPISSFWKREKELDPRICAAIELDKEIILSLQDRLKFDSEVPGD